MAGMEPLRNGDKLKRGLYKKDRGDRRSRLEMASVASVGADRRAWVTVLWSDEGWEHGWEWRDQPHLPFRMLPLWPRKGPKGRVAWGPGLGQAAAEVPWGIGPAVGVDPQASEMSEGWAGGGSPQQSPIRVGRAPGQGLCRVRRTWLAF